MQADNGADDGDDGVLDLDAAGLVGPHRLDELDPLPDDLEEDDDAAGDGSAGRADGLRPPAGLFSSLCERAREALLAEEADPSARVTEQALTGIMIGFAFFMVWWQFTFYISLAALEPLLDVVRTLLIGVCGRLGSLVPGSPYELEKLLAPLTSDLYCQLAVCTSCSTTYHYEDAAVRDEAGAVVGTKACSHKRGRAACGSPLLELSVTGEWRPRKIYHYMSLKQALTKAMSSADFRRSVNRWREQLGRLDDVYDSRVWQEQSGEGRFLYYDDNLALLLSLDFVNPFGKGSSSRYSVGVLSAVILNLPRTERYRRENVLVLGVIPGPREPSLHINGYLEPIVRDLLELDQGVIVDLADSYVPFRARLFAVAGDLPAVRKFMGFVSFSTEHGCSKCWGKVTGADAGSLRTHADARRAARHYKQHIRSKAGDQAHARTYFARWTPLYKLKYFDVIRYHLLDPMHGLFLGIVPTHLEHLFTSVLTKAQLKTLDARLAKMGDGFSQRLLGRLPTGLTQYYKGMRAEQHMNFVLYYSEVAFFGLLPREHYDCWLELVRACRGFCSPVALPEVTQAGHEAYERYLERFAALFDHRILPNHHQLLHLRDVIADFGPVLGYWLYPFERLNGSLQDFPTNGRNLESQILRRCVVGFLSARSLVNDSFTAALSIPRSFLEIISHQTVRRQARAFLRRATPRPDGRRVFSGSEPLDGRFVGAPLYSFLPGPVFELLRSSIDWATPLSNYLQTYGRFALGSFVLTAASYRRTTASPIAFRRTGGVLEYGTVDYFVAVTNGGAEYKLAFVTVWPRARAQRPTPFPCVARPTDDAQKIFIPVASIHGVYGFAALPDEAALAAPVLLKEL